MINAAGRVGLERLPCACHILHNSVKAALEKQEPLNSLVVKLHNLASFFHRSPKMAQALELEQLFRVWTGHIHVRLDDRGVVCDGGKPFRNRGSRYPSEEPPT
ncbi:MAG: hypothetical protein JOS17DRAFT_777594 [Linnemannia elongata]|nr:MAG: hypothetical protein JOS17DRAFT_777594 [Linnemannia elongata]